MAKTTRRPKKNEISSTSRRAVTLPIDDPFYEKDLIEDLRQKTWLRYVSEKAGVRQHKYLCITPLWRNERISEVYRLCYEKSSPSRQSNMIRDFVAFHPLLVFDSPWLAALCREQVLNAPTAAARSNFLGLLALGFRRAAARGLRYWSKHRMRMQGLRVARGFRTDIQKELRELDRCLERPRTAADRRDERDVFIAKKVVDKWKQLQKRYPRLTPVSKRLMKLLLRGKIYKAATLVAATVYDVRQRDLEVKPD